MAHIGIDLGTSNTLVAVVSDQGNPEVKIINNLPMVPSIIYIEKAGGNTQVGAHARSMWADGDYDADRMFRRWKLQIGAESQLATLNIGDSATVAITPEYLTTRMVEYIVNEISHGLGGEKIDSVLVTVPHGWRRENPQKCRATRSSAAAALPRSSTVLEMTVSEPVAAAAYWTWEARRSQAGVDLDGKTVLVCDMGGGTFDLSLIRVGGQNKPLDVIDAANNELAGDYADALICAWACKQFNANANTNYPTTAELVLEMLSNPSASWIRGWFLKAQELKQNFTATIEACVTRKVSESTIRSKWLELTDANNRHQRIQMDLQTFRQCLEPFYKQNREFLASFIRALPPEKWPHAVLFAGGGSRIYGVRDNIVRLALRDVMNSAADAALDRINVNSARLDQVIALGAALIANGIVTVQERLLHNIGLVGSFPLPLAKHLALGEDQTRVLITPILRKGEVLPTSITSKDLGLKSASQRGESLEVVVVIDDDTMDPWKQTWRIPNPGHGDLNWALTADTDGVLTVAVINSEGVKTTEYGFLERKRTGQASLLFGADVMPADTRLPRFTPEQVKEGIRTLRPLARP